VAPPPAAVRNPAPARPRLGGSRTCCWPIGEPGTPEFRFCEADPLSGKPYCAEHAAIAYVKPREKERREDAA
jgi:GcrA cell cycle regulator